MSRTPDQPSRAGVQPTEMPRALAEYAEQLLIGTGLGVADALRVARGEAEVTPELSGLAEALRAGWSAGQKDAR
jgi:hypothetical protein